MQKHHLFGRSMPYGMLIEQNDFPLAQLDGEKKRNPLGIKHTLKVGPKVGVENPGPSLPTTPLPPYPNTLRTRVSSNLIGTCNPYPLVQKTLQCGVTYWNYCRIVPAPTLFPEITQSWFGIHFGRQQLRPPPYPYLPSFPYPYPYPNP